VPTGDLVTGAGDVDETEIHSPNFEIKHNQEVRQAYD